MITLYDYELSGNCYKIRLLMGFLGVEYTPHKIDFYPGRQHKSEEFRKINPLGQLPVLDDDGLVLRDAQAILVYLASKYDTTQSWYPHNNPNLMGQISQWLAFSDDITRSSSAARLHDTMLYSNVDVEACRAEAHRLFRILDEHLYFSHEAGKKWICPGDSPTIADIACFPYVMLSEDGGIPRIDYPAIRRWCDDVKRIPNFVLMSGVFMT